MTKLVLLYGIELDNNTANKLNGVELYETVDGKFYLGALLTKGTDKTSLKIPVGEDYTENYYDDKFYSYFEDIQSNIEDEDVLDTLDEINNEDTPDLYVLNIK